MYIIKDGKPFTFGTAENPEAFALPAMSRLSFADAKMVSEIEKNTDTEARGRMIKEFIVQHNPAMADMDIGDFQYFNIYSAWAKHEGSEALGE